MIQNIWRYLKFEDGASGIRGGGTAVDYLEPALINQETVTREIGREHITICYQSDIFLKLYMKNNKYKLDMELKLVWGVRLDRVSNDGYKSCRGLRIYSQALLWNSASCGRRVRALRSLSALSPISLSLCPLMQRP